jgi:uncharacterized protein
LWDRLLGHSPLPVQAPDQEDALSPIAAVLDFTDEVTDYIRLYRAETLLDPAQGPAAVLTQAARQAAEAIRGLPRGDAIHGSTVEVHRLENEGDRIVRGALEGITIKDP